MFTEHILYNIKLDLQVNFYWNSNRLTEFINSHYNTT